MSDKPVPPRDPLDLVAVDRAIRINELTEQVRDLGPGTRDVHEDCPPEVEEQFLRNIIDHESAPVGSPFQRLTVAGLDLPPPDSLDDAAITAKLWEVIHALAARDTFLVHTDHLSDRRLYQHLWTDSLREGMPIMPPGSGWMNHIDLIGSGSDKDIDIGLRYYDTEEQRGRWASDVPKLVIPPHENPPYDRDRHLPAPDPQPPGVEEDFDE